MASTFYIDANRQNSTHISSETNSEWTYKLSNNIQLPAGTEIGIQDTFIHKQGISGATIEIDEDITERMYFSVYLTDNPHYVPYTERTLNKGQDQVSGHHNYIPSFRPFSTKNPGVFMWENKIEGFVNDNNNYYDTHNSNLYYGYDRPNQRVALWEDQGDGNPRFPTNAWCRMNDAYLHGGTECPMMAIYVDENERFQDSVGIEKPAFGASVDDVGSKDRTYTNYNLSSDNRVLDYRFKPYVKFVDIVIKKGVYSISEISDIIENQINGVNVDVATDGLNTDTNLRKKNTQTFDGMLDTEGIYSKAHSFQRNGCDVSTDFAFNNLPDSNGMAGAGDGSDTTPRTDSNDIDEQLRAVLSIREPKIKSDGSGALQYTGGYVPTTDETNAKIFNSYQFLNPTGNALFGFPNQDQYVLPHGGQNGDITHNYKKTVNGAIVDATIQAPFHYQYFTQKHRCQNTTIQAQVSNPYCMGRKPKLPTSQHLMYIPVHMYNQLIKMWKYNNLDPNGNNQNEGQNGAAHQNSYLQQTSNWTANTNKMFRWAYQQRNNMFGASNIDSGGEDNGYNAPFIGLHYKTNTATIPNQVKSDEFIVQFVGSSTTNIDTAASATLAQKLGNAIDVSCSFENFNYDLQTEGYYVGTPDFKFQYTDSSFTISGLHQSCRVPSRDAWGNAMTSEGESVAYLRRTDKLSTELNTYAARTLTTIGADFGYDPSINTPENNAKAPYDPNTGLPAHKKVIYDNYIKVGAQEGVKKTLINALNANQSRVGGVAVYNWAYNTAKKYGDVNPDTFRHNKQYHNSAIWKGDNGEEAGGLVYDSKNTNLWKFQDFFTTKKKALEAWDKTLWGRLGFSFDNLQNSDNWETTPYYDIPVSKYTDENPYFDFRTGMYLRPEDFKVYGKTTDADIQIDVVPTISTTNISDEQLNPFIKNGIPTGPGGSPAAPAPGTNLPASYIKRTYDNHTVVSPAYAAITANDGGGITIVSEYPLKSCDQKSSFTNTAQYTNSMYWNKAMYPILTQSKSIVASGLPKLSNAGYYIITSDIVDGYQDEVKQGQPLPLLGVVPISNLSNQDFISTKNDIIHTLQQTKNLNSVKIKILNPNLTSPTLLENSSVLIRITTPIPQPQNTPMIADQTDEEKAKKKKDTPQPNPTSKKTQSGGKNYY